VGVGVGVGATVGAGVGVGDVKIAAICGFRNSMSATTATMIKKKIRNLNSGLPLGFW
jgi:hypothetical protein